MSQTCRRVAIDAAMAAITWPTMGCMTHYGCKRSSRLAKSVGTTCVSLALMGVSFAAAVGPQARATAPIGVSAVVLSKQTAGGTDYIVSDITVAPGGSTGWHTHRGEIYGIVKAGELTHYSADCKEDGLYGIGDPITDPTGPDHVHLARNLGTVPVVLEVTYLNPAGAPTSDSVPNPGCDFA